MTLDALAACAALFGVEPPNGWKKLPRIERYRVLRAWVRPLVAANHPLIRANPYARDLSIEPPEADTTRRYRLPGARNLIYHVCPLRENDAWRENVRQLASRMHVFNHKRVVAVATGPGIWPLEEVQGEFSKWTGEPITWLEVANDPILREVASFLPLLYGIAGWSDAEATFYAHTKGNSTTDSRKGSEYWRNAMYHHLLDDFGQCMVEMETYPCVGTHKMAWLPPYNPFPTLLNIGSWMYAGTFFWFRNDCVFLRSDWNRVARDRYGAEAWLSSLFPASQASCMWAPWDVNVYPTPSPYDPQIYDAVSYADDSPVMPAVIEAAKIPGLIGASDLREIAKISRTLAPGSRWVELGSLGGRSLLAAGLTMPRGTIAAIDNGVGVPGFMEFDRERLLATVNRLADRHNSAVWLEGDSLKCLHNFADGSIDGIFFDGDHDILAAEFAAWLPKVRPGGVVLGHDYQMPKVAAAVDAVGGRRLTHSLWRL